MKNRTFKDSIICAIQGLIYALRTEKNYKYYLFITLCFFLINLIVGVPLYGYLFQLITTVGVFSTECINTSIEHFVNLVDTRICVEIKLIKDIAASCVLCWGIGFFICEFVIIGGVLWF